MSGSAGHGAPGDASWDARADADWDEAVDTPPDVQLPVVRDAGRGAET